VTWIHPRASTSSAAVRASTSSAGGVHYMRLWSIVPTYTEKRRPIAAEHVDGYPVPSGRFADVPRGSTITNSQLLT
jgi:hypothetical protein